MAFRVNITVAIEGDRNLFERASRNAREPRELMRNIGVLGMRSALLRLDRVLKAEDSEARTGDLAKSLNVGPRGSAGTRDTIFRLSGLTVVVGTALRYAAQVQFGGTILPVKGKALAIPITPALKRSRLSPRDIDPSREKLVFRPFRSAGKPNVIGGLFDDGGVGPTGRRRQSATGHGSGLLFVLVTSVTQKPRPFLFWSEDDQRVIRSELFPDWLLGA